MQKKRTVIKYLLICLPIFLACNIPQTSVAYEHSDFIANLKKYKVIEPDCDGKTMEKCKKLKNFPRLWDDKDYFESNKRLLECLTKTIPEQNIDFFSTCNIKDIENNVRDIVINKLFPEMVKHCDINAKDLVGSYETDSKNDFKYADPIAPKEFGLPIIFNDSTCIDQSKDPLHVMTSYRVLQTMLPVTYGILLADTDSDAINGKYIEPFSDNLNEGYLGKEYLTKSNWHSDCSDYNYFNIKNSITKVADSIFKSNTDFIIDRPEDLCIFPGLLLAEHDGNHESIPGMLKYDGNGNVSVIKDRYKATKKSAIDLAQKLKDSEHCNDLSVYVIALPTTDYKAGSLDKDILGGVILYGPAK